jgi:CarboxypepD_reg-like domain
MLKWIGSLLILFDFSNYAFAQSPLSGKILKKNSHEIIPGVNIRNLSNGAYATSDQGGNFKIVAIDGNTIIFSSAGYISDTLNLKNADPAMRINIYLRPNIQVLADVEVDQMSTYIQDSIKRREDYAYLLNKKHPVKFMNEKRPGDDPGFSFSPIGYFSKSERQKRELKKRIKEEDEAEYIDVKFPESRVAQLTKLTGDTLRIFMFTYRPSYSFCRKASNKDMFLYINDKFVLFKKQRSAKT